MDRHQLSSKVYVAMDEARTAARIISRNPGYETLNPQEHLDTALRLLEEVDEELRKAS